MNKYYFIALLFLLNSLTGFAQQTSKGFTFNNEARTYIQYIATSYNSATDNLPIVFALHGLGDTKENFNSFNGFQALAESEKFILITPQAENPTESVTIAGFPVNASALIQNAWHSGAGGDTYNYQGNDITLPQAYYASSSRDDVGFIRALLDTVSKYYNIDTNRIYSTGFSMGGFMTNKLGCEMSDKIAAIASVSGTIGNEIKNSCNPDAIIPALHIHSIDDETVSYNANTWGMNAEESVDFWVMNNNCNLTPDTTDYTNVVMDNDTSIKYLYAEGDSASEVEFYHLEGPNHVGSWYVNNKDFKTAQVIWDFFERHTKKRIKVVPVENAIVDFEEITYDIFPNPASDFITLSFSNKMDVSSIAITNTLGKTIQSFFYDKPIKEAVFNIEKESKGIYFFQIEDNDGNKSVVRFYKK